MGMAGFVTTLVLLLLNLFAVFRLQRNVSAHGTLELLFVIVSVVVWLVVLLAVYWNRRWAWPLNTVLFSLSLANILWLFTVLGSSVTLAFALGVNVFGLFLGLLAVDLYQPEDSVQTLETYDVDDEKKSKRSRSKS